MVAAGVLAALAAQQVAENLNERRLSKEARAAILAELNVNITNVSRRFSTETCWQRRLDELDGILEDAGATGSVPPLRRMRSPGFFAIYNQRWEAATASGRTALLGVEEQRAIGRVYDTLDRIAVYQKDERHAWTRLAALRTLKSLTREMLYDQRVALAEARVADGLILGAVEQARFFAKSIGVKGDAKLFEAPNMGPVMVDAAKCEALRFEPQK